MTKFFKEKSNIFFKFGWNNLHYLSSIYYAYKHNIKIKTDVGWAKFDKKLF